MLEAQHVVRVDGQTLATTARVDVAGSRLLWTGSKFVVVTFDDDDSGGVRASARDIEPDWTLATSSRVATVAPAVDTLDTAGNAAGDIFLAYGRHVADAPFLGALRVAVQAVGDVQPMRRHSARP